jgi:N-acetylated-alpha-linked acidic dipeptidase
MRPARAIQRGSVYNGIGDPTTPRGASVRGTRRTELKDVQGLPKIPVVAISAANAAELLRGLAGVDAPEAWRGGLGFDYHVGPGPVSARVQVQLETGREVYKEIWNTFGTIRGTDFPEEIIVVGAHRDAWGPGAADDVSGTVSVLEMARAVAEAAAAGHRPRRTIVFATWDAEEWSITGSTEWVEQEEERLFERGVAYFNQDVAAAGLRFGAGGSPSLRPLLRDAARLVADPAGSGTVYEAWRRAASLAADSLEPRVGDPGGGSDFAPFYNHLGIPHTDWGFGGPYGVYHSQYDTHEWMSRYGDPAFRAHTASAQLGVAMLLRMANADVLPFDYLEFARTMRGYLAPLDSAFEARGWSALDTNVLRGAIDRMERSAASFARARDEALARGEADRRAVRQANAALMRVERALTRRAGLRGRPWYRGVIYASDQDNGYATVVFPTVVEAMRAGDRRLVEVELADLAQRFIIATNQIITATEAMTGENR